MKMQMVWEIAKERGVPFKVGVTKGDLIREIQVREGYSPCFQTREMCDENPCLWREDCLPKR
jgi:hypothetical protein